MASPAITQSESLLTAERSSVTAMPWFVWTSILAVTCAVIGLHWDISWHRSVGRDTFWTPAHLAIQFCGVLAGLSCGYMILATTFRKDEDARDASVRVLGFRGPLGAFVAAWGGLAMVFSAPFDNWWHDAYGLDVKIVSPPHTILALGIFGVAFGSLLLILAAMNRAEGTQRVRTEWAFLYVSGMIFTLMQIFIMEYLYLVAKHTSEPYIVLAIASPVLLAGTYFALDRPFACTITAAVYTAVVLGLTAILPLFAAEPKLGPVYQAITYFVPPPFPPMVIVPALAMDLLFMRTRDKNRWVLAVIAGVVFVVFMVLADWNMARFILQSKLGQARFFHLGYVDYGTPLLPNSYYARHEFWPQPLKGLVLGLFEAVVIAVLSTRLGIARGDWTKKVRR